MDKYISTTLAAKNWSISPRRVMILCANNQIPGAIKIGRNWKIPEDAQKPSDGRVKGGNYIRSKKSLEGIEKTALIVDDSEMFREIIKDLFDDSYQFLEAENGLKCLDIVKEHKKELSIIILDLIMPEMNGFEVLSKLQNDKDLKYIPVIVITAENDPETIDKAIQLGACEVINKPIESNLVKTRISNIVDLYYLRRPRSY